MTDKVVFESKNKYRGMSRDRDKELEEEIAALEAAAAQEIPLEEPEKPMTKEDESWKKRYGDLRSHAQKQEDVLKLKIKELEKTLASSNKIEGLRTKEEVLDWKNKFPDLFGMLRTIILEEVEDNTKVYEDRFKELDEREQKMARRQAYAEVCEVHPDFPQLVEDDAFQNWIDDPKTPQWVKHALQVNDTDSSIAIDAVDLYKLKFKKDKKDDTRDAARAIKTPSRDAPNNDQAVWSESRVEALNRRDTEKYWPEIEAAMAAGKFEYDISGAAR